MQCPNCKRENEPTNRFCIFCGSPLQVVEGGAQPTLTESGDTLVRQVQALREEVRSLSERLSNLERAHGIIVSPVRPAPAPASPQPIPSTPTAARMAVQRPVRARPAEPGEWEQILGGNWLARIGVLALLIGVAFFLKFAFDNNWIGPIVRIIMGIVAGLAMLGGGYFWRRRYPVFAQTLSGGGIGLLYLSFFAAFYFFNMISFYPAIILLFLVSAGSAVLAVRQDSMALAILGIIGAFLAPFVLGLSATGVSQATGQGIQLLAYVMVVDIGVLILSTFRNWRWFTLLAFVGSLIAFSGWYDQFGSRVSLLTSEGSLTIIFLIFVAATTLFHVVWRRPFLPFDYALTIINAIAYLGISYGLMWGDLRVWMGGFTLLLALFYGGLAYIAVRRGIENARLASFAQGISLALITIAVPVQFAGRVWTPIVWAVEGTLLVWLSFASNVSRLRDYSYAVFILMALRLLIYNATLDMSIYRPVLNERFLAFLVGIAAIYLVAYLFWRQRETLPGRNVPASIFVIAANFLTIWLLSFEVWDYFGSRLAAQDWSPSAGNALRNARNLSLSALWAIYALVLLVIGILKRIRLLRLIGLALLTIPILKVFIYDIWALGLLYRIIAFIGLGLLLLAIAYLYQRHSRAIRGFLTKE